MRRVMYLLGVVALLAVGGGAANASATGDGPPEMVTICHVAGLASDPANYITLTLPWVAVYGEAGHFFENGTPRAGHEQDTLGECNPPPPVDVCPNLEGNQSEVPPGYHLGEDENGRPACLPDEEQPQVLAAGVTFTEATCTAGPSFHLVKTNGLPFYDVEGPDFVNGLPVPGGTYTFTVIVPEGYVIEGQTVWVHTFAPAPTDCGGAHVVVGDAQVICLLPAGVYQLSGHVDGQVADSVSPPTLPGNTKGISNVVVTRGDTSVRTTVQTNGDCGTTTTVTTAPPPAIQPTVVTSKPPATTPKPPVRKPTAKPKPKPKPKPVAKPKPRKPTVHICLTLKDGTPRIWMKGRGCVLVPGKPQDLMG